MPTKHTEWQKENTRAVGFRAIHSEYEKFEEYCRAINVPKASYIKLLINSDAEKRGMQPIFANTSRNPTTDTPDIPESFIDAITYAKENSINRTTMIQRLKKGKYPSAIHVNGKWYIDPNEI